jgi:hypothetical protein
MALFGMLDRTRISGAGTMLPGMLAGIKCRMEDRTMASPAAHAAAPLREMKWSPAQKAVLPLVFAALIRDGNLSEDDLRGLGQDKLKAVLRAARLRLWPSF